jgi:hypothetical protein
MTETGQWGHAATIRSANPVCLGRRHEILPILHLQPDGRDFGRRPELHGHRHVDSPTALSAESLGVDRFWGTADGERPGNRTDPTLGGSEWAGPDSTVTSRLRDLRLGYVTRLRRLRRAGHQVVPHCGRRDCPFFITEAGGAAVPDCGRGRGHTSAPAARPSLSRRMVDQELQDRGQDRRAAKSRRAGAAPAWTRRRHHNHNECAASFCWTELIIRTNHPAG